MIRTGCLCLAMAAWLAVGTSAHAGLSLNYDSVQGSQIEFQGSGDTFSFVPTPGTDFEITSVTDGVGDAVGLVGSLGGTFSIGTIMSPFAGFEVAPVSGSGTLAIFDGSATLTADISWVSIFTMGAAGGLNGGGVVNLSNIAYAGTVADLLALAPPPAC